MSNKLLFNTTEDEVLVEMVSKYECLYDYVNPNYKNQGNRDNAWKEVAQEVQRSVEDCKKRWRNIKDTFHKRARKCIENGNSGQSKPKPWFLENMLSFLPKVDYTKQQSVLKIEVDVDIDSYSQDSEEEVEGQEPPTKKPKFFRMPDTTHEDRKELIDETHDSDDDDVELFFRSMAASVKKLPPPLIMEAKLKTMQLLSDLQSRM